MISSPDSHHTWKGVHAILFTPCVSLLVYSGSDEIRLLMPQSHPNWPSFNL